MKAAISGESEAPFPQGLRSKGTNGLAELLTAVSIRQSDSSSMRPLPRKRHTSSGVESQPKRTKGPEAAATATHPIAGRSQDVQALPSDASTRSLDVPPPVSFEGMMQLDPGSRVISFINPVSEEAARGCLCLASTSRTLYERVWTHPSYASFRWMRNLHHAGDQLSGVLYASTLRELIHAPSDIGLPHWTDAQKTRTEMLVNHLACHANGQAFQTLLHELFKQTEGHTLASRPGMFIDPRRLASAALNTIVRHFGFDAYLIKKLMPALKSLSTQDLAAFLAELAIGYRDSPRRKALALRALGVLLNQDGELFVYQKFADQATEFLKNPGDASPECIAAMMDHLHGNDTPLSPSSVELLLALAKLVPPPEDTAPPEDQSARLQ